MSKTVKQVGLHRVIYDEGVIDQIQIVEQSAAQDVPLRTILKQLQKKAAIARHNINNIYPTAMNSEAREYVTLLENAAETLEAALRHKEKYVQYVHGHDYLSEMILTKEEIN